MTVIFQKLTSSQSNKLLLLAMLSFVLAGSCMLYFDGFLKNEWAPWGIISLELAQTLERTAQIIETWKQTEVAMRAAELSLWFDYLFIISYVFLLCFLIDRVRRLCWNDPNSQGYRLGTVLMQRLVFAGFLDMIENLALLQIFYGDLRSSWASLAYSVAVVKFAIIILGLLYLGICLLFVGIKKRA